jgi:flagellar FliL protein
MSKKPEPTAKGAEDAAGAAKPKGKKGLLIGLVAALVLAGGGAAAYFMMKGGDHAKDKAEKEKAEHAEPAYLALDPPFVVNFQSEGSAQFLQVTVQVMSRDPAVLELVKRHDPVVRNALLMLFSGQSSDTLASADGKEKLRVAALGAVRKVIAAQGGKPGQPEDLYFTSFVMQ